MYASSTERAKIRGPPSRLIMGFLMVPIYEPAQTTQYCIQIIFGVYSDLYTNGSSTRVVEGSHAVLHPDYMRGVF
jgi:hypothetical protein